MITLYKQDAIFYIVWSMVGALLLGSCSTSQEAVSTRLTSILASRDDCIAPCWRSITPGESTEENFLRAIDVFTSSEVSDLKISQLRPEGVEYLWENKELETFIRVRLHDSKVALIGFHPSHNDFSLMMFIDILGQPDSYGASILGSEKYYVELELIYESQGIIIDTNIPITVAQLQIIETTCEFEVDWETPQNLSIYFLSPDKAEEIAESHPTIGIFTNPAHKPQVWTNSIPVKLTMCP